MKRYVVEFVGTFLFVFTIALSGQPLAIGLMLAALIYIGGHISGGHYNPAVTLAMWIREKIATATALGYVVAQMLGGFVAAGVFNKLAQSSFTPSPLENVKMWEAMLLETIFTFVFCSVILTVVTSKNFKGNFVYGFAIGLTFAAAIMAVGKITGGAFNPAVGISPLLYDYLVLGGYKLNNALIYLVGPCLGSLAAAIGYKILNND